MSFEVVSRRTLLLGGIAFCCGCRSVPMTGRRQLLLSSEGSEAQLGLSSYEEVLKEQPASKDVKFTSMVEKVGHRIAAVSGRDDFKWEFRTLASEEQNAFCLPGGKVAVYEGIAPICANEAGLAVVMSHEIGHALARHGGERMAQAKVVNGGQMLGAYVMRNQDEKKRQLAAQVYGLGSQYGVILPYSRQHELEADEIGLMLMSKAGYDPAEAPEFWKRFGQSHAGQQPFEYTSTHPSDERRSNALAAKLPEANELYQAASEKIGRGSPIQLASHTSAASNKEESEPSGSQPVQAAGFKSQSRKTPRTAEDSVEWAPARQRDKN